MHNSTPPPSPKGCVVFTPSGMGLSWKPDDAI